MKKIKAKTYFKIVLFFAIFLFVLLYPKNLFDSIISDIFISLFSGNIFSSLGKLISYIFHDKILLLFMGLLGIFLVMIKEYKKSIFILSTAFFGSVITLFIKYLLRRERPLPELFDGYSFPSGHSTVVALFFLSLLFVINKKGILSTISKIALVIVPISRIMIGAHYPTDVLAGLLIGSIVVDLMKIYYDNIYKIISRLMGIYYEKK